MQSKAFLLSMFKQNIEVTMPLIEDLRDHPLAFPTANGGNHALWIAGHLAFTLGWTLDEFLQGKPNRFQEWKECFDSTKEPTADADRYPPFDEVFAKCKACYQDCVALLESLSEEDLDEKVECPSGFEDWVGTKRHCFRTAANHLLYHYGQLADTRRSLGRKPLFA